MLCSEVFCSRDCAVFKKQVHDFEVNLSSLLIPPVCFRLYAKIDSGLSRPLSDRNHVHCKMLPHAGVDRDLYTQYPPAIPK